MDDLKQRLNTIIARYRDIKLAVLFGSRAKGTESFDSDLDIAVLMNRPLHAGLRLQMTEELAAEFGCPVDIVDLFFAPEPILGEVLRGERLLGSDAEWGALLSRHLVETADFLPLQQRILDDRRRRWIEK